MDILTFFTSVFGKIDNVAILILLVMLGYMAWRDTQARAEYREDRKAMLDALSKNTDALHAVEKALVILSERVK